MCNAELNEKLKSKLQGKKNDSSALLKTLIAECISMMLRAMFSPISQARLVLL